MQALFRPTTSITRQPQYLRSSVSQTLTRRGTPKSHTLRQPSTFFLSQHTAVRRWANSRFTRPCTTSQGSASVGRLRGVRLNSSNKPSPNVTPQLGSPAGQVGLQQRLKKLFKEYGWVSVGVYFALSALDLPLCFLAVRLAGPERVGELEHYMLSHLKVVTEPMWRWIEPVAGPAWHVVRDAFDRVKHGAVQTVGGPSSHEPPTGVDAASIAHQEALSKSEGASIWTQLAIAYGIHKTLLIFVRVPLTAAVTPKVVRTLRSWGWRVGGKSTN